jgi:hypothetical protein
MLSISPDCALLNSLAGTSNYEVFLSFIQPKLPKKGVQLSSIFTEFETNRESYGIRDWGISNTSNF